jgi:2-hydroxy-6-oxonona-2,4-dienedioate hydrolase
MQTIQDYVRVGGEAGGFQWEFARADGVGPVAVLLPGLFAGGWLWDRTWVRLREEGFRVLRLRNALAEVDAASGGIAALTFEVERVLDRLKVNQAILCGNSMGALIALDLAHRRPGRVEALVMSGAPGLTAGVNLGIGTPRQATRGFVEALAARLFYDRTRVTDAMIDRVHAVFAEPRCVANIVRALRAARRYGAEALLRAAACPILMIWGADDGVTPAEEWKRRAAALGRGEFHAIPRCGHSPMLERPEEFDGILVDFLRRARARAASGPP